MHLTTYTDYSLRVLIYLKLNEDRLCNVKEVSEFFKLSNNHIVKVVNNLGKLGLIETFRGKGGGIKLVEKANSQKIGQLVRQLEPDRELVDCVSNDGVVCGVAPVCNLIKVLDDARESFYRELDNYTLEDAINYSRTDKIKFEI